MANPMEVVAPLLTGGVGDVQTALGRQGSAETVDELILLHRGINRLVTMNEVLGVSEITKANVVFDEVHAPRVPIVENALLSLAVSPGLDETARLDLIDMWRRSASAGEGRIYPRYKIALMLTPAVIERYFKYIGHPKAERLDELVTTLDAQRLGVLRTIIKYGRRQRGTLRP